MPDGDYRTRRAISLLGYLGLGNQEAASTFKDQAFHLDTVSSSMYSSMIYLGTLPCVLYRTVPLWRAESVTGKRWNKGFCTSGGHNKLSLHRPVGWLQLWCVPYDLHIVASRNPSFFDFVMVENPSPSTNVVALIPPTR